MTDKVLFVDDEGNILKSLRRLFLDEDFDVITAGSGTEALEILRDDPEIGLIVSDQRMPEMTGVDFLEKSKEISPDALRILLTGYADINAAVDSINRGGAYRYLSKPWKDEELIQVIKDAANRSSLLKENKRLAGIVKRQNEELRNWNNQLEVMVQQQTIDIQAQNASLIKLNEQLEGNFRKFIEVFSNLIEMRDKSVSSHSRNVAALARQTAMAMALPDQEITDILVASLLHDIGKIGVPDSILMKDVETLIDFERKEYELHPVRGQAAVSAISEFREAGIIIRHHHEQVDGLGYPDGLKKNNIPAGSRIIALADAVDRLANSGPSAAKNDYNRALKHIEFYLNTKFDSDIFHFMRPFILEKMQVSAAQNASGEIELHPDKLMPGMVLSRDVRSGTGLLLLAGGIVLEQKAITGLRHYYGIDPPKAGVFVRKGQVKSATVQNE